MRRFSAPPEVGAPAGHKPGHFVQTERKAHEAWARFCIRKPTASAVLHHLVASMGHQNAVVIPQKLLAQMLGVTDRTIRTAVSDLQAENWIQVVRIGKGREAAYVVNDQVAWGQPRDQLRLSVFSATIVADAADQDPLTLEHRELRRIPTLYPGERQLPTGPGEDPPSQPSIPGMEPDLPALIDSDKFVLRIHQAPSGQWAGRLLDSTGKEVGDIADCASPEAVQKAATESGIYPDRIDIED